MSQEVSRVSALVVTYQSEAYIERCIDALISSSYPISEVVVVDNASTDNTVHVIESHFPQVRVVKSERNLGFAGGVNLGLNLTTGEVIALVNPDVVVHRDWLGELVGVIDEPDVGIAGGKLLFGDGRTIQHAGGILRYPLALTDHYGYRELDVGRYDRRREVDYVTGAALVVKRNVIDQVGGLDDGFYPAYFEETDLCWRIRESGLKVVYVPAAVGIHYESTSAVRDSHNYYYFYHRNRLRFVLKNYTDSQFLQDFLPAEEQRLGSVWPVEEKQALRRAYREVADQAPQDAGQGIASRPSQPVIDGIEQLWRRTNEWDSDAGKPLVPPSPLVTASRLAKLRENSEITERPFISQAPVVGPAIARFREAWNWVSTKWYVAQLFRQQNRFNSDVVDNVVELENELAELRSYVHESTQELEENLAASRRLISVVEQNVAEVEQNVAELEQNVAEVGQNVAEVEQMAIFSDRKGVELTKDLATLSHQLRQIRKLLSESLVASAEPQK